MTTTSTPPPVSLAVARKLMEQGKPWRVRIINTGHNPDSKTGSNHNKFWEAIGKGRWDDVKIRHGRRDSSGPGAELTKNWAYIEDRVPKKLGKGYTYDATKSEQEYNAWHAKVTLPPLDVPYSLIASFKEVDGTFECYDANGARLVVVTPKGLKQLRLKERGINQVH